MNVTRATALWICGAILLATTSAAAAVVIPTALSMRKLISWGYGCGGHCAFNHRGDSTVTLAFGGNGDVTATDNGSYTFGQNSPGGHREETREWHFKYAGTWSEAAAVRTLDLKLTFSTCATKGGSGPRMNPGTEDKARPDSACPEPNHKMKLTCKPDRVTIGQKRGAPDAGTATIEQALVCRPGENTIYFGTTPPWTFGTERPITTKYVGEPQPETVFSIEK